MLKLAEGFGILFGNNSFSSYLVFFMCRVIFCFRLLICVCIFLGASAAQAAVLSGERYKWHPVSLDFKGPLLDETSNAPNPFLDYRLTVTFTSPSGQTTQVPGFFAGDGQGGSRGDVWRAIFSADETGRWLYRAELRASVEVAVSLDDNAGRQVTVEGASGEFDISNASSDAPEFLRHGRLEYIGAHYMKFRDGPYWIKGGTDSPENLLGFAGIDGTVDQGGIAPLFLHNYEAHRNDWSLGDPLFSNLSNGVDSRGIIGALNYLGEQGVNSVYFLPMNLGGDGQETYPFIAAGNNRFDKTHYDISKLHQWNMVLNHAQKQGIALNIVLSETEEANERWLDNGELGVERKLFFRELVARFGYLLAVKWNLGEENDFRLEQLQQHADYIRALDWSNKPIAVHTHINQFYRYGEIVGDPRFSASSIQYDPQFAGQFVEQWRANSAKAGHPWVIDMDENTNGLGADGIDERRKQILYDVLFSGGNIEWYFGYYPLPLGGDITAGNFRLRETMWRQMRLARQMMERELPFWKMEPADSLVEGDSDAFGGAEVFALRGNMYAIYLPQANGNETLDIGGTDVIYKQRWFNPRTGQMYEGRSNLASSSRLALGAPPAGVGEDWVTIISAVNAASDAPVQDATNGAPRFTNIPSPIVVPGQRYSVTLTATDSDGTFPVVTVGQVPGGMRVASLGNGRLQIDWTVPATATRQSVVELIAKDARDDSRISVQRMTIEVAGTTPPAAVSPEIPDTAPVPEQPLPDGTPRFIDLPNVSVAPGNQVRLRLHAIDDSGLAPSVTVGRVPAGMRVNGLGNGVLELTWQVPADFTGQFAVELIAIDPLDSGVRNQQNLIVRSLNNASAPVLRAVDAQSIAVGQVLSINIAADDADGVPPALLILNAPQDASFNDNGDGTRTFVWQPTVLDVGRRVLTFVALDNTVSGLSDTMDVVVTVR